MDKTQAEWMADVMKQILWTMDMIDYSRSDIDSLVLNMGKDCHSIAHKDLLRHIRAEMRSYLDNHLEGLEAAFREYYEKIK